MDKKIIKQTFCLNRERIAELFGQDALVVYIHDGQRECFSAGIAEYEHAVEISLDKIGGEVTTVYAIKWEDGITRKQRITEKLANSGYKATIAVPLSQVA